MFAILVLILIISPFFVGLIVMRLFGRHQQTAPPALLFHSISNEKRLDYSYLKPEVFAAYCDALSLGGKKAVTVSTYSSLPDVPEKPAQNIILAFDDGFEDFYHFALPILEKYKLKATVFIITDLIGKRTADDVFGPQNHLNESHIKEISRLGHEIGSHTCSHADLSLLGTKDLQHEIVDSKHLLEDLLGAPIKSLSFPYGSWSSKIWKYAKDHSYSNGIVYRRWRFGNGIIPALGAYAFDTVSDLFEKTDPYIQNSPALACARVMPHFAKGTSVWKFRESYSLFKKAG
jgi:peptidoglycan/xylan/chitin deacetylase (PgdA/CDA1 family)